MPLAELLKRLQTQPNDTINEQDREALGRLLHIPQDQLERMAADQTAGAAATQVTVHGRDVHVGTPGLTTPAPATPAPTAPTSTPETETAPVTLDDVRTLIREELTANRAQEAEAAPVAEAKVTASETDAAAPDDALAQVAALRKQVEAQDTARELQEQRQQREQTVRETYPQLLGFMNTLHDMSATSEQMKEIANSMPAGDDQANGAAPTEGDAGPGLLETVTGPSNTGSQQTTTKPPTESALRERAMEIMRTLPGERTPEVQAEFNDIQNQRFRLNQQLPLGHPRRLPSEQLPDEEVARLRLVRQEADEALTIYENSL